MKEHIRKIFENRKQKTEGFVYGPGWVNLTHNEKRKWIKKFRNLTGGDAPPEMKKARHRNK